MKILMIGLLIGFLAHRAGAASVGDPAPDVAVQSTDGKTVKISDFRGQWVVLYFYPKAFTPGCTTESCSLRDGHQGIRDLNAVVLGASLDTVETQKTFKQKNNLPFELLADTDKALAKAYDALALGGIMAARKTFVIDPDGKIAHIFTKVDTATHEAEVRKVLADLQAARR